MNPSSIVDSIIPNISKELCECTVVDITTAVVNNHFNSEFLPEEIYKCIYSEDGDERNLDVNNMVLVACYQQIHLSLYIDLMVLNNL